jgi:hypothetical protein
MNERQIMRASRLLLTIIAGAAAAGLCFALAPALDHPAHYRSPAADSAVPGKAVLRVTDAQGVNVLETDGHAMAPTEVRLPAAHYRVSARFGGPPRSETVEVISVPEQELATR